MRQPAKTTTRKQALLERRQPERVSDAWRMTKVKGVHTLTAVCSVYAVELSWGLRLMIDGHGLQMSSLCRLGSRDG